MSKIICKLPNASLEINGIAFEPHRFGVISKEPLDAEQVAFFTSIQGYEVAEEAPARPAAEEAHAEEKPAAKKAAPKK